ncbi:hypothetical protein B9Z55_020492 [Caenorhabditis nigoni]|uniref:Uncharacterized protein n=1 Tax=Caenorhabditis nigoni TaxID=1611254 RepID=A0A2G5TNQ4_9PELO|nr:hypothetical protein B9Z55_020492 [Caenorhabditis nigoni]
MMGEKEKEDGIAGADDRTNGRTAEQYNRQRGLSLFLYVTHINTVSLSLVPLKEESGQLYSGTIRDAALKDTRQAEDVHAGMGSRRNDSRRWRRRIRRRRQHYTPFGVPHPGWQQDLEEEKDATGSF